jgi:hypothetical protein
MSHFCGDSNPVMLASLIFKKWGTIWGTAKQRLAASN